MLGCLSQCIAWQILGWELNSSILPQIKHLPDGNFPVDKNGESHQQKFFKIRNPTGFMFILKRVFLPKLN